MDLDSILVSPPGGYWLSRLDFFRNELSSAAVTGDHLDRICDLVSVEARLGHKGRLTNWLSLGFLVDATRFVARIKRTGVLRASKYDFNVKKIKDAIEALLEARTILNIPPPAIRYLNSVNGLLTIADDVLALRSDLERKLRRSTTTAVKSLLATIDSRFTSEFMADREASTDDWHHYFREELADAASYCLYLFNKMIPISATHFALVDERGVVEEQWMSHLVQAAKIRSFVEWEILVDSGLYSVEQTSDHEFVVRPLDARTEKAIRLGFISAQMAELKEVVATRDVKALDHAQFAEQLHALFKANDLIATIHEPLRRVVLKFPINDQLKEIIGHTSFFREEGAYLQATMKLCLMEFHSLFDHKIGRAASLWDLMVVWRLLHLLCLTFWEELRRYNETDPELVVRSQLPVFQVEQLKSLLGVVTSADACDEIFQLLRWTPGNDEAILDLQYRPFITADGYCILPLNIIGQSNFIRNALYLSRTRPLDNQQRDPVEGITESIFQSIGASTIAKVTYSFQGNQGEIDVLAYLEGSLFVLECKNSLLPVSPFEFRTTLDHIRNGARQLSRIRTLFEKPGFPAYLASRSGLPICESTRLVTCIVTGNRMMSGALLDGHPIRGLFELGGFLSTGGLEVLGKHVHLIEGERPTASDVVNYLLADTVHRRFFDSMIPRDIVFKYHKRSVTENSYVLLPEKLATAFGVKDDFQQ